MAKKAATKSQKNPDDEEIEEIEEEDDEETEESPAPEEVPDEGSENKEGDGEPVNPPAGSHKITIEGGGTTPIIGVGGKVRTVERGVEVEVDDEELAYLKQADLPFKAGKKK